jgi:Protein of unknown function (DUF3108)
MTAQPTRRIAGRPLLLFAAAMLLGLGRPSAVAETWPPSVRAVFDVNFTGINVGTLEFRSSADGQVYTLTANAKLSALLGVFNWNSDTRSSGRFVGESPKPAAFTFDYNSNSRAGSTKMSFADDTVTNVTHVPPVQFRSGIVPVHEQHLKGVLDPLSAVLALTHGSATNPCSRRIPIYDGRQRFDLLLSYRGQTRISEQRPSGQPGIAYVCRVRYLPIAGHRIDQETKFMASTNAIEIVLRPIPSAHIFIPYQITIPTIAGAATLVSKRIDIVTPSKGQIALVH